ncbi:hypothetical protein [Brevundimonas sp.]|uniref:hypothetical protein n=1 Tax=Brevundimonas sp. TaxID=1871086 RepID=UPI002898D1C4|nr:hypothetical protein [Brevundimonas sp.]
MSRVDCNSHPLPDAETLRDRFAMAALTGLLAAHSHRVSTGEWAKAAYRFADAMMEARK